MCIFYFVFCQNIPVNVTHRWPLSHRTITPAMCCVQSQICLYTVFTLNLFPESPPSFELHKCRCTRHDQWANLSEFEQASESCREKQDEGEKETARRKVFLGVEAEMVRCADSSPLLCEVFRGCLLPRYLSPLAEWEGSRESAPDERGISLTKSVSTTKRRLYQIPLIPTQRCHTNHSPALSCYVKKKNGLICRRQTSFFFFFPSRPNRNSFNISLSEIFENFEMLMFMAKIGSEAICWDSTGCTCARGRCVHAEAQVRRCSLEGCAVVMRRDADCF